MSATTSDTQIKAALTDSPFRCCCPLTPCLGFSLNALCCLMQFRVTMVHMFTDVPVVTARILHFISFSNAQPCQNGA